MPQEDVEHGKDPNQKGDSEHELGSTKLWTVYISEAEKYDKALVESWRNDMGGMLIFAGLFSGSLTAFIIESYKNLTPDPGESVVTLLQQISAQLNGSTNAPYSTPGTSTFTPPVAALLCNALWFISLTLSLTCALVATLVEQWARDFLHRADVRSAPVERARIFSYLYYGLKRFKMHSVVEVLPLLLHASLVLFFAGLVAFLAPVNTFIMILGAGLLAGVVSVYMFLTILPLVHLDCPYRTPLSGALWRAFHAYPYGLLTPSVSKSATRGPDTGTMILAISRRATEPSDERSARDKRALVWTVKSLADDSELEPLVESIPDVFWGPNGKRHTYDEHIITLVHSPEARLLSRISDMLHRCDSGILTSQSKIRRQIACYKALWAISTLDEVRDSAHPLAVLFERPIIPTSSVASSDVKHYMISAVALARWNAFCSLKVRLARTINVLSQTQAGLTAGRPVSWNSVSDFIRDIHQHPIFGSHQFPMRRVCAESLREVERNDSTDNASTKVLVHRLLQTLEAFLADIPHLILFDYLSEIPKVGAPPYQFDRTRESIILGDAPLSSGALLFLEKIFDGIVSNYLDTIQTAPGSHLFDKILGMLISYWRPQLASMPCGLVRYLDRRGADGAVLHIVWNIGPDRLWSYITTTLTEIRHLPPGTNIAGSKISLEDLLRALWRLYSLRARIMPALSICESALDAVLNSAPSVVSPCVIALIKANIVDALHIGDRVATGKEELSSRLAHPILAIETVHKIPRIPTEGQSGESSQKNVHNELQRALHGRTIEARFQIMSELLECCTGPQLPYNILKTLSIIKPLAPPVRIHGTHQNRLAATIGHLFRAATARQNPEVLEAVLNLDLFNVYAPAQDLQKLPRTSGASQGVPWMDHPKARRLMKDFLVDYEESLISSARPPAMVARVKTILHGIDTLHPSALP